MAREPSGANSSDSISGASNLWTTFPAPRSQTSTCLKPSAAIMFPDLENARWWAQMYGTRVAMVFPFARSKTVIGDGGVVPLLELLACWAIASFVPSGEKTRADVSSYDFDASRILSRATFWPAIRRNQLTNGSIGGLPIPAPR